MWHLEHNTNIHWLVECAIRELKLHEFLSNDQVLVIIDDHHLSAKVLGGCG